MTCAQCDAMREELHYLRSELGLRLEAGRLGRLRDTLHLRPRACELLLILHNAKGKIVTHAQLRELMASEARDEQNLVAVYIAHVRDALGSEAVLNSHSRGYALAPEAIARVSEILNAAD